VKISKEFKIGLLIFSAIAFLFFGVNFLKGIDIFQPYKKYYAIYPNVEGLSTSDYVLVNGLKVGIVNKINFMKTNPSKMIVEFSVTNKRFDIPKNTKAVFRSRDILGTKCIELRIGDSQELAENYDTLIAETASSVLDDFSNSIAPLKGKSEAFFTKIDLNLDSTFAELNNSLRNLSKASNEVALMLSSEKDEIHNSLKNVEKISNDLAQNSQKIGKIIDNLEATSDSLKTADLKKTLTSTRAAVDNLNAVMIKINKGEGTMGKLVNDKQLYGNLTKSTASLDSLLVDMKKNPKRYVHFSVFGKKDKTEKK